MAKFNSTTFVRGAEQQLARGNFPAAYKNASAALALGAISALYYLCVYYRHQMDNEGMKGGGIAETEASTNFCTMYQLSENFQIRGYAQFTSFYTTIFSKMQSIKKTKIGNMVAEYTKYLQSAQKQYTEETRVDFKTAKNLAEQMEQNVLHQTHLKMQHAQQPLKMGAPLSPQEEKERYKDEELDHLAKKNDKIYAEFLRNHEQELAQKKKDTELLKQLLEEMQNGAHHPGQQPPLPLLGQHQHHDKGQVEEKPFSCAIS